MRVGPTSISAAKYVATRNILNPLLWLDAIIAAPSIATLIFGPTDLRPWLLTTALVPPTVTLIAYAYWTFKDPDRLQSEEFALEQRRMSMNPQMGDNATQKVIEASAASSFLTTNSAAVSSGGNG